jgi:hypothetical protein
VYLVDLPAGCISYNRWFLWTKSVLACDFAGRVFLNKVTKKNKKNHLGKLGEFEKYSSLKMKF